VALRRHAAWGLTTPTSRTGRLVLDYDRDSRSQPEFRLGVRGGFGTAEPMVSATFRDSCRARGPGAGGRLVTASFMPTVLEIFVIRRAGGRPGVVPGESTAAGHRSRSAGLPGKARGPPGGHTGCTPGSAVDLKPGKMRSARPVRGRPWNRRRCAPTATTVHTDRRNCAYRPSLQHGRPSAMRPWTAQYDDLQRSKVTHAGTEKKRPASARIRS
jgi:hypothetical protein